MSAAKVLFFFIIILICFVGYCNSNSNKSNQRVESIPDSLDAFLISKKFVLKNLKAPSTAVFPDNEYKCSINNADSTYIVTSYVDSQNSFGAQLRSTYIVTMKFTGRDESSTNWNLIDINIY